jgi:predicted nucleic acid-binding protein
VTDAVIDASALAVVAFKEPGWEPVLAGLDGRRLHAPTLLAYELANVAWKKARRQPKDRVSIASALGFALGRTVGLAWHEVPGPDALVIAQAAGITAYDASYLWLAGSLGADLVTLDRRLARAALALDW